VFVSTYLKTGLSFLLAIFPLFALAVGSDGCGSEGPGSGTFTMDHDGIERTYRVFVPDGYQADKPGPVVFIFHGWGGNENAFLGHYIVTSVANQKGYILVAPRGLGSGEPDKSFNSWSFSGSTTGLDGDSGAICDASITADYSYASCKDVKQNTCSWTQCQANDVDFTLKLIEEIKADLCVDEKRIFASGGSNGGMYAWGLGQSPTVAPHLRAIAPIIGLPHRGYLDGPGKQGHMPALVITGTKDDTVPPGAWNDSTFTTTSNGSDRYYYTGATAITRVWADAHDCDISEDAKTFDDGNPETDCRTFCSAETGWPEVLDCRADMGHINSFSWSWKLVLDFFDAHSVN
jgi:poly(3-hydroxybutyrate) depolymerase